MKLRGLLMVVLGAVAAGQARGEEAEQAEQVARRVYETRRVVGEAPVIDGRLDDPVWDTVEWAGDFIQRQPADGEPPTQQSAFKVVYSDDAIYFAFRLYDDPAQVTSLLARRDYFPGDWIEVNIDSYFDHRTAYSFTLSLSGTLGDEFISSDGSRWDSSWNPVWTGATQIDDQGWTGEARIPLGQLRFSDEAEQTWGLQVQRRLFRLEQRSTWQRIPVDVTGWVSRFGELRGFSNLQPKRRIELLPYVVARAEHFAAEAGNPFRDGSTRDFDAGIDGKIGVTNNLTLDFTINPDFGQVEADPSQVNLTAYETYFREQRPFFVEGNDILDLRLAPAMTGGSFVRDNLFYSRRIGGLPSYTPESPLVSENAWVENPDHTTIVGAFKLTGKTDDGLAIGILDSVTGRERARYSDHGESGKVTVEPWTNYFVGRLEQDFGDGDTQFGGMVTAVNRKLDDDHLDFMRSAAYAGGLDFATYFAKRDYRLAVRLLGSQLRGSEEAIYEAQTSSARYYQRPDNEAATLDPTRTTLSGHAGSLLFTRTSNHELMFQTGVAWRSPGFEISDLGYMRDADRINQFTWVGYRKRKPFGIFDNWGINANQWLDWDFAGNHISTDFNINSHANFRNKYSLGGSITRGEEFTSNTMLRGGPSSRWPGGWQYSLNADSDRRRKLSGGLNGFLSVGDANIAQTRRLGMSLRYRPTNAIQLTLRPSYTERWQNMQYIDTATFGESERYLFGRLDQETISLTLRLDYAITPRLTVQLYASPFISTGRYSDFKRISDPRADRFRDRFSVFDAGQIAYDGSGDLFEIDENRDGEVDYSLSNPDFDVREFHSNLVIRWEYSPGSTLYLVWSQGRENSDLMAPDRSYRQNLDQLFATHPTNVVLLKISKWFSP